MTQAAKQRDSGKASGAKARRSKGSKAKGGKALGKARKPTDRWFDLWLTIEGEALHDVAEPLFVKLDAQAAAATHYKRGATKRELLKERARIVIANLAYAVLKPPPTKRLAVSLMHGMKTRYDNGLLRGEHLREIIAGLKALGVVDVRTGGWGGPVQAGTVTTIAPSPEFASEIEAHGVVAEDFVRAPGQEVLLLKRADPANLTIADNDEEVADTPIPFSIASRKEGRWVVYSDCPVSLALRDQVMRLGAFMAAADIRHAVTGEVFDATDCLLRRHFTQPPHERTARWDLGGRFFYRRLSHLKRDYRRGLTINGSPVAELDFKAMFPTLAYGVVNTPMPDGDAYRWQGLESYRDGVKTGLNTLLFGGGRGAKFGKEVREALPKAMNPAAFRRAFLRHHPALEPLLSMDAGGGLPIGYRLMNTESRIMALVLERLMRRGIVGIGLHDGLIIGTEHKAIARGIMGDTARELAGVAIPVEDKG
jgi:hypothetical protein